MSAKKGKVGRPRISEPEKKIVQEGVVYSPLEALNKDYDSQNVVEIIYDDTKIISDIFNLIDSLANSTVKIYFNKTYAEINFSISNNRSGIDSNNSDNEGYIKLHGNKANRYYVQEYLGIEISAKNLLGRIAQSIKVFNSLRIIITGKSLKSAAPCLQIVTVFDKMDTEDTYSIPIIADATLKINPFILKTINRFPNYPLSFNFSPVFVKQCVNNSMANNSSKFKIYKDATCVLKFEYLNENNICEKPTIFKNAAKINLFYDLEEDDIISYLASFKLIDDIVSKPVTDYAKIFAAPDLHLGIAFYIKPDLIENANNVKKKMPVMNSEKILIYIIIKNNSDLQILYDENL